MLYMVKVKKFFSHQFPFKKSDFWQKMAKPVNGLAKPVNGLEKTLSFFAIFWKNLSKFWNSLGQKPVKISKVCPHLFYWFRKETWWRKKSISPVFLRQKLAFFLSNFVNFWPKKREIWLTKKKVQKMAIFLHRGPTSRQQKWCFPFVFTRN